MYSCENILPYIIIWKTINKIVRTSLVYIKIFNLHSERHTIVVLIYLNSRCNTVENSSSEEYNFMQLH